MYIPKYAGADNLEFLHAFVEEHNFGTLCTQDADGVFANHFPFLLDRAPGNGILWTHMARNNPQWQRLKQEA